MGLYLIDDFPDMTLAPINVKLHSTKLSSVGRVLLTSQASSSSLESPSFDSPRPIGSSSMTPGSYKKQKRIIIFTLKNTFHKIDRLFSKIIKWKNCYYQIFVVISYFLLRQKLKHPLRIITNDQLFSVR